MTKSLQSRIQARLDERPEAPALAFFSSTGEFFWQSREQVYRRASSYGRKLVEWGIGSGDVCLLVLPSQRFCATLLTGVLISGASPLLMAPPILQASSRTSSLLANLKSILTRTRIRLLVAHESLQNHAAELQSVSPDTILIFGEGLFQNATDDTPLRPMSPSESDTAALQLTSGTTGVPRICRWQQRQVLAALDGMALAMALAPEDICLNWTPLYHDMGLANNFLLCLIHGTPLVMLDPIDFVKRPALWLRALSATGATITWAPNFGYAITTQRAKDAEIADIRLDHVRTFWNAAEKIHLQTVLDFHHRFARFGVRADALKMNFGCVENVGGATFTSLDKPFLYERLEADTLHNQRIARRTSNETSGKPPIVLMGVGRAHPTLKIVIVDDNEGILPDGHVGEILLDTPSRMTEYVAQPEETRQALLGPLIRTGDLGYLRDGELFWVGRARERITVRGRKIDPSEFESILWSISDLRTGCFAAFGIDQAKQGTEEIVLVAELNESASRSYSNIAADIQERVNSQLGLSVNDVVLVGKGTVSKTSSGKRRHRHFRELYLNGGLESVYRTRAIPIVPSFET